MRLPASNLSTSRFFRFASGAMVGRRCGTAVHTRHRTMVGRRGYMLVEMLIVITIGGVVLATVAALLMAVSRTESAGREHVEQSRALGRLAEQFRRDVHAATSQHDEGAAKGRQFELGPGRAAVYRIEAGKVIRSEETDGRTAHTEEFSLPPDTVATIEEAAGDAAPILSLTVTRKPDSDGPVPHATAASPPSKPVPGGLVLRVDGTVGWDHRFAKATSEAKETGHE